MEAAFKPEVNGELDTQNFEKFEEVYFATTPLKLKIFLLTCGCGQCLFDSSDEFSHSVGCCHVHYIYCVGHFLIYL